MRYKICLVGCIEDLRRIIDMSAISQLGSRRWPISEIQVARPGIEPWTSCSASQELNHSTTAAPLRDLTVTVDCILPLLPIPLKLYCRYLYTRPCMINHIWSLKQLWLQVNGHAWFHLQRLRWPIRNVEGAKNSKWKYMSPAGFEPTPCQSTTGKLQRLRPLGHEGLMVISG